MMRIMKGSGRDDTLGALVARIGEATGEETHALPTLTFAVTGEVGKGRVSGKVDTFLNRMRKVIDTAGSLGTGTILAHVNRANTKTAVYTDVVKHAMSLVAVHKPGSSVRIYLLDSNGSVERASSGAFARRTRDALQLFLNAKLEKKAPFVVEAVRTPNVNFRPSERENRSLQALGVEDSSSSLAWCAIFSFIFLVEAICTHGRNVSADTLVRFLYTDVCRRAPGYDGTDVRMTLTSSEKVEFILYARALALGLFEATSGVKFKAATVTVTRGRDPDGTPTLRIDG